MNLAHWSNQGPQTKHVDRIGGQVVVLSLNYGYLYDDITFLLLGNTMPATAEPVMIEFN